MSGTAGVSALAMRARGAVDRARVTTKQSLLRIPTFRQWSDGRYQTELMRHAENLPWIPPDRFDIVAELRREYIATRLVNLPDAVQDAADHFVARLREDTTQQTCIRIPAGELASAPAIFRWGLAQENLDLVECYIGLPVRYLGVEIKRERPPGATREFIRDWHMDAEDRRMLKIVIYLSDVDEGCGPFEYLDRPRTERAVRALNYVHGFRHRFLSDTAVDHLIPAKLWRRATGPRLTAVYADTSRIMHRIKPPSTSDRYSMTFVYSSTTPHQVFPQFMPPRTTLLNLRDGLTASQRCALMIN
jgi:hypothetical protein